MKANVYLEGVKKEARKFVSRSLGLTASDKKSKVFYFPWSGKAQVHSVFSSPHQHSASASLKEDRAFISFLESLHTFYVRGETKQPFSLLGKLMVSKLIEPSLLHGRLGFFFLREPPLLLLEQ